ncbi:MAG: hypothetical protein MJ211_01400 [Bacteroidales bacterium]|nr:hypothetical protein [Bacteroidales bacterium]
MKEYIFYTTEGFTYPPINETSVENYQVLGRSFGKNIKEARHNLIKENPWIVECGFDINKTIAKQLMTEDIKQDINTILEYLMKDEYTHFLEMEKPNDHIYCVLRRLKKVI